MGNFVPTQSRTRVVVWDIYCRHADGSVSHHYRSEDRDEANLVRRTASRIHGEEYGSIVLSYKHIRPLV